MFALSFVALAGVSFASGIGLVPGSMGIAGAQETLRTALGFDLRMTRCQWWPG